jgi:membrane protease YdiL (CAAX protease family)
MIIIRSFIQKHPVLTYYALTFAISWGGVLILGVPYGMPATSEQFENQWPVVFVPYFLGPTTASLLLTGLIYGRAGFRELLSHLFKWRVGPLWYAVALLTASLLVMPILFALSLTSPVFLPNLFTTADRLSLILSGILVGLVEGGLLEELGWTGFAVPEMRRRYSVLNTGLIVGVLWGLWHLFPTFWGSGDSSGSFSLNLFLPPCFFYLAVLPAFRVLMVWVYDRTASLLVVMLMHASLTANTLFILLPKATGVSLIVYYLVLAAVLWLGVIVVQRRQALPQPVGGTLPG